MTMTMILMMLMIMIMIGRSDKWAPETSGV